MFILKRKYRYFLIGILLSLLLNIGVLPAISQMTDARLLVQLGESFYKQGFLFKAADSFQSAVRIFEAQGQKEKLNLAITLTNLGQVQLDLGQSRKALENLEKATDIYSQSLSNKNDARLIRSQIYLVLALQDLGYYLRACSYLTQLLEVDSGICQEQNLTQTIVREKINVLLKISESTQKLQLKGWRILGDLLRGLGKLEESELIFKQILPYSLEPVALHLSLGNTLMSRGNLERDRQAPTKYDYIPWRCELIAIENRQKVLDFYGQAEKQYVEAVDLSNISSQSKMKAQLNLITLKLEKLLLHHFQPSQELIDLQKLLTDYDSSNLPLTQTTVYNQLKLAKSQACLSQLAGEEPQWQTLLQLIVTNLKDNEVLNKVPTIKSYLLGNLGGLYEYAAWCLEDKRLQKADSLCQNAQECFDQAKQFTQEALYLSQPNEAPHIAYQWQWQLGRILAAQKKNKEAIAAYEDSVKTLETIRSNLLTIQSDVQFSFRDNVEPVYRQLVSLLLLSKNEPSEQINLKKSRQYIESLQLAELENFLKCQLIRNTSIEIGDRETAIIYPILLKNRLEIILSLPQKLLIHHTITSVHSSQLEETAKQLRKELIEPGAYSEVKKLSQSLYQWLIEPLENELEQHPNVQTLVFVLDSSLRSIPMGVLYNAKNQEYLIQKYAIALSPGLELFSFQALRRDKLNILLAGITEAIPIENLEFPAIPYVEQELGLIKKLFPHNSKILVNQDFTKNNFIKQARSGAFSVIHVATHGVFSSNPEQTYILAYDRLFKGRELKNLIKTNSLNRKNPDLLVLSACQTAKGDRRAALGMAGIAVGSGASSTLATLWSVNDRKNAESIVHFYQEITQLSKVKALQKVQIDLLKKEKDPYYWSPYVLIGNWR